MRVIWCIQITVITMVLGDSGECFGSLCRKALLTEAKHCPNPQMIEQTGVKMTKPEDNP